MDSTTLLFPLFILFPFLSAAAAAAAAPPPNPSPPADFITSSCKITRYPDVCVSSLRSYAPSLQAKRSQSELVKDAVIVSLNNARNTSAWALALSRNSKDLEKIERAALTDCVENLGDTSDQIKQSLTELKNLKRGTSKFQMSNIQTWMSAALTNEDSCLNGFQAAPNGKVKMLVQSKVQDSSKFISNALALINNLASTAAY